LPQHHDEPVVSADLSDPLAPHRQAVQEFITTRQGYRLATSTGGVLTAHGTVGRLQRFCGSYDPEQDESGLANGLLLDSRQAGTDRYRTILTLQEPIRFTRIAIDCTTGYFGLG
jgi:hypothetical protein